LWSVVPNKQTNKHTKRNLDSSKSKLRSEFSININTVLIFVSLLCHKPFYVNLTHERWCTATTKDPIIVTNT